MLLEYFTEEAYEDLFSNISTNADNYRGDEEWLAKHFAGKPDYYKQSSVEVGNFIPSFTPGKKSDQQKCEEDLVNTRLLYDAFMNLTPIQATNKYMWAYLCHANKSFNAYIRNRWMQDERENTIRTRFFVKGTDGLLNDNALSRLWWYGHLTYDRDSKDHYALTAILLSSQTLCTDVMDTLNRTNLNRMKGVLMGIKDFMDIADSSESIPNYFRECKKSLNHYAAVTTMDYLDVNEIRTLTYERMLAQRK